MSGRRSLPGLAARVWLFLFGVAGALALVRLAAGWSFQPAVHTVRVVAAGAPADDSWGPMSRALDHLERRADVALYDELFFARKTKFQYPPSALLPFDLLERATGRAWPATRPILDGASRAAVVLVGLLAAGVLLRSHRVLAAREAAAPEAAAPEAAAPEAAAPEGRERGAMLGAAAIVVLGPLAAAAFYPIGAGFELGQLQTFLTLLAAAALFAWQRGHEALAGVLLAASCAMKPQLAVFLPWALVRRRWGAAAAFGGVLGVILGASIARYGLVHHLDYLPVVEHLSRHGESYHANQSVNGLVNRWLGNGNNLRWDPQGFPPYHPVVHAVTLASSLALLGGALAWRWRARPTALDLAILVLAATMASPIAWQHHYGVAFPAFALLTPFVLARGGWLLGLTFTFAFVATSHWFDAARLVADSRWNVLQSHFLFGGLALLGLLLVASRDPGRRGEPAS